MLSQRHLCLNSSSVFSSCVTLGKLLNLSEPLCAPLLLTVISESTSSEIQGNGNLATVGGAQQAPRCVLALCSAGTLWAVCLHSLVRFAFR